MKEKTLYRDSEYDAKGGGHIIVFANEDGIVSYRFGGWNSKRRHKCKYKIKKKPKPKQKVLGDSWKGNKSKTFTLDSGNIDGWNWGILCIISINGSFHSKGRIDICYYKSEFEKERRRKTALNYWHEHRKEMLVKRKNLLQRTSNT